MSLRRSYYCCRSIQIPVGDDSTNEHTACDDSKFSPADDPYCPKAVSFTSTFLLLNFFFSCDKFNGIFGSQYWLIISDHFWSYISKLNNEKNGCVRRPFSFFGIFSRLLHDVYEKWNIIWTKKKLLQKCGFKFFFNYLNPLSLDPVEFRIYTSSIDESE